MHRRLTRIAAGAAPVVALLALAAATAFAVPGGGKVRVRDFRRHKTVLVKARHSNLARAKRHR